MRIDRIPFCFCGCGEVATMKLGFGVNYYSELCYERVKNKALYPFKSLTNKEWKDFWDKEIS